MKTCVCGYKRGSSWDKDENHIGDEDFINIVGMFFIEQKWSEKHEVQIYACPKCGTLKMD
jgi:hypothetical protein